MEMEKVEAKVARMIENTSWQNNEGDLPVMSTDDFNTFLRNHLNKQDLSDAGCAQIKKQLVNSGFLLDFQKLVILKPQWLADSFKAILSFKNEGDKGGRVSKDQILKRLGFGEGVCQRLLWIWEKQLNVCIADPILGEKYYIIPSLLDEVKPKELDTQWNEAKSKSDCVGRVYTLPFVPAGIFEGIFVKIFGISHVIQFWKNGLLLRGREEIDESFLLLEIASNAKSRINSTEFIITIQATG